MKKNKLITELTLNLQRKKKNIYRNTVTDNNPNFNA